MATFHGDRARARNRACHGVCRIVESRRYLTTAEISALALAELEMRRHAVILASGKGTHREDFAASPARKVVHETPESPIYASPAETMALAQVTDVVARVIVHLRAAFIVFILSPLHLPFPHSKLSILLAPYSPWREEQIAGGISEMPRLLKNRASEFFEGRNRG